MPNPAFYHPRYLPTWISLALLRLFTFLPASFTIFIGRLLGKVLYKLANSRREVVVRNIELCFAELDFEQQQALAKRCMEENAISILETARAWWLPENQLKARVTYKGEEHLKRAAENGNGILFVSAHYTLLDLGGRAISLRHPIDGVYRQHNNRLLDQFICRGRGRFLQTTIDRDNVRQLVKRLRQGKAVWYAPDQDMGRKNSVFVPFFGVTAATITGTSRLARLGNATVVVVAQHRLPNGNYEIEFYPQLENFPSSDEEHDATRINQALEQAIRKDPAQYMWTHRRFKTHPNGKNFLYKQTGKD